MMTVVLMVKMMVAMKEHRLVHRFVVLMDMRWVE